MEVNASKTGFDAASAVQSTLAVDLTVPTAPTYTAPGSLKVGVAISAISPSSGSGIAEYGATGLPPGLNIDTATGVIGGTPDTADANAASATVTVTDTADNAATVLVAFPVVAKGDQTLTGFQYSSNTAMLGSAAPTVTAPSGAQGALSYSVTASTVCAVGPTTGVLTLVGVGDCEVTATAADTADYNEATATYTVTVQPVAEPLIAPTAIAQPQGDSLTGGLFGQSADNLIDGSGLSDTPTEANLDTVTHSFVPTTVWVTQTDGTPDYFGDSRNFPDPQFTLTLDGLYSLSALVIWGYGGNANVASDFTVEFSTDGGNSYSLATETVQTSGLVGNDHARLSFGQTHEANFVRLTITNNAAGRGFSGAGGGRVGLGEIRFVGSAVASNAPELVSAVATGATLTLTYDKDLAGGAVPPRDAFIVTVNGTAVELAVNDPVTVSGRTVILTLASAVAGRRDGGGYRQLRRHRHRHRHDHRDADGDDHERRVAPDQGRVYGDPYLLGGDGPA